MYVNNSEMLFNYLTVRKTIWKQLKVLNNLVVYRSDYCTKLWYNKIDYGETNPKNLCKYLICDFLLFFKDYK